GILLLLRKETIGPTLELESSCPDCGSPYEFSAPCVDLLASPPRLEPDRAIRTFTRDDLRIDFRLATSRDLAATADHDDRLEARRVVFARCIREARRGDRGIDAGDLDPEILD